MNEHDLTYTYDNHGYYLDWNITAGIHVSGYSIFWCRIYRQSPNSLINLQCVNIGYE